MGEHSTTCWAILDKEVGLLGIFNWFDGSPPAYPPQVCGCRTALFRTRKEARKASRGLGEYTRKRRKAVMVRVTIDPVI